MRVMGGESVRSKRPLIYLRLETVPDRYCRCRCSYRRRHRCHCRGCGDLEKTDLAVARCCCVPFKFRPLPFVCLFHPTSAPSSALPLHVEPPDCISSTTSPLPPSRAPASASPDTYSFPRTHSGLDTRRSTRSTQRRTSGWSRKSLRHRAIYAPVLID